MRLRRRLLLPAIALPVAAGAACWGYAAIDRTPGELLRYAARRLAGHPMLEAVFAAPLQWTHDLLAPGEEDLPPPLALRGVVAAGLPPQAYDETGAPLEAFGEGGARPASTRLVGSGRELATTLEGAAAGDVIELLPGRYEVRRNVWLQRGGTARAPIVVRARTPGSVRLEMQTDEGFVVAAPYWIFENLHVVGTCTPPAACEHAFHIVGEASGTVLRNNVLQDFNNPIKVNGVGGDNPDRGLLQHNHIFNSRPRATDSPVVGIDIVAASGWTVTDNLIADIAINSTAIPAYAAFMKGGGSAGRFERNLIICQLQVPGRNDIRVGISLGGGGTGKQYVRDPQNPYEHQRGTVANNIVAHCSDFGIDINNARDAQIAFNTLLDTSGIDVRNPPASASIYGNLLDGRIRAREGAIALQQNNRSLANAPGLARLFDTDHRATSPPIPRVPGVTRDFCGTVREDATTAGALEQPGRCLLRPPTPLFARSADRLP